MWINPDRAEVLANFLRPPRVVENVLVHEVLEPDLACAADIQRDLPVPVSGRLRDIPLRAAATQGPTVELWPHAVFGQQNLDLIVATRRVHTRRPIHEIRR